MSGMPVHHANALFVPFARFLRLPSSLRRRRDRSRSFLLLSLSRRLRWVEVLGAGSEVFLLKATSSAGSASLVVVVVPRGGADTEAPGCSSRGTGVPEARFAELRKAPGNEWQTRMKQPMYTTKNPKWLQLKKVCYIVQKMYPIDNKTSVTTKCAIIDINLQIVTATLYPLIPRNCDYQKQTYVKEK